MKICVYCSSSSSLAPKYYEAARAFGRLMGERGHSLVYGGYGRGVMGEVARGVYEADGAITAVVPGIFDREGFTFEGCAEVIKTAGMSDRKAEMERLADGFAALPGGIGTFDELFEVLCLRALGELKKPVAVLNAFGYYDPLRHMLEKCRAEGFMNYVKCEPAGFFDSSEALLAALEREAGNSQN